MQDDLESAWRERAKLRAEGDKLRAESVLCCRGNITTRWIYRPQADDFACELETGEVFEPITPEGGE